MGFAVVVGPAFPFESDVEGARVFGVRTVVGASMGVALLDEPPQPVASAASPR